MVRYGNENNYWEQTSTEMDISRGSRKSLVCKTTTLDVRFDPHRAALIIIDMQNFFLSEKLGRGDPGRKLCKPIKNVVGFARKSGIHIIWLNWGVAKHLANLSPSILRTFQRSDIYTGFGNPLPHNLGPMLLKNTWSTELTPELESVRKSEDLWIDKNRTSGFFGTDLNQILTNLHIKTLFFAGVNTDQCVLATLYDANSLGYDCILLSDCTATTSPKGAYESVIYNVQQSGFVLTSYQLLESHD